ncbi:unnamed protein product [Urochloa humidicola]
MANSRSFSSSSGHGGWQFEGMGAPVPYREGPLAYEPAVLCQCRMKAPRWMSWSDDNPGRRYYQCRRARSSMDCGFFLWMDAEHTPFMKNLLLDLRNAVRRLKKEIAEMEPLNHEVAVLKQENQMLEMENLQRMEELEALKEKTQLMEMENLQMMEQMTAMEKKIAELKTWLSYTWR